MKTYDFIIVGSGIVGIATACSLLQAQPGARVAVLEKEKAVALHQSGRNSGVIHAGVYYDPGSLKARFCSEGKEAMRRYCDEHGILHNTCGKLIVAVNEVESERLAAIEARSRANGIEVERLNRDEARELEPNIKAESALLSPTTGIVDFAEVARSLASDFQKAGGEILLDHKVLGGTEHEPGVILRTSQGEFSAGKAVFCAGLHADHLARMFGAEVDFRIIPFRGEYYRLKNQPKDLVRHLIYPVPDPERPFLGVHLTRKMDGGFTVGPNAVLAFAREGYSKFDFRPAELASTLMYPGFWRLLAGNSRSALEELSASMIKQLYLKRVRKYCDLIKGSDLVRYRPGIRAQAVWRDGRMVEDFLFRETQHTLHVCNAPSPAATSSLPIGQHIAEKIMA
tara:strand:- start:2435 stop:3625 length:1191 start_codon:yes stop_codon:yes gene_type:complete